MRRFYCLYAAALIIAAAGFQSASPAQTKITANNVVINGESFFDQTDDIKVALEKHARDEGLIGANDHFRQIAVSGSNISRIAGYYDTCNPAPVYLISDGGGIDLMGTCPTPVTENCTLIKNCKTALQNYLAAMKRRGTKKLLWMIYPDPVAAKGWATLKANQDVWAQVVPPIINACTDPKTLLVDLRPVWAGHYNEYTGDGIHPTLAGSQASADAFWKAIKESNFFDLQTPVQPSAVIKSTPSMLIGQTIANGTISLSLFVSQQSTIALRMTTVSGRTIHRAEKQEKVSGFQTVQFPLGGITRGVYCIEVTAGGITERAAAVVR